MGLWVLSGSWAAGEGLDGFIPDYMVEDFGGRQELVDALVKSGLWVASPGGTSFHQWTEYNPDSETVKAGHAAKSEGAREGNHKRWHVKRQTKVPGCEWCFPDGRSSVISSVSVNRHLTDSLTDTSTDTYANPPDPTRPDPTPTSKDVKEPLSSDKSSDRGSLIPDEWRPGQQHIDKANSLHLDVKREYQKFRASAVAKQRRMKNWNTGFTNWLRKAAEFTQQRQGIKPLQSFAQQRDANALELVNSYRQMETDIGEVAAGADPGLRALDPGWGGDEA